MQEDFFYLFIYIFGDRDWTQGSLTTELHSQYFCYFFIIIILR